MTSAGYTTFGTGIYGPQSYTPYMQHAMERPLKIADLRAFAERPVCVRLEDHSEHVGTLRTELLSDRSISVFLSRDGQQGATIYIDEIVSISPLS